MTTSYFFGYGSLVNENTHDYKDLHRAKLAGWRRSWRHTNLRPIAFLTAIPDQNCTIEGIIAHLPNNDWVALDEREYAYDRHGVTSSVTHSASPQIDIAVYQVPQGPSLPGNTRHPILLSYLDVVVQGYFSQFGASGVAQFFETTSGWDAPILNDRPSPRYPRAQILNAEETDLVDAHLNRLGAKIITQ